MNKRMWTFITVGLLTFSAIYLATASPPGLLNKYDRVIGGDQGALRVGGDITFGDHGQTLDVWRNKQASNTSNKPVIIFWHGGGWVKGSRQDYAFAARAYAEQGYVVVVPDYRKVPIVHFPEFVEDGAQAVRWVVDNISDYGGDPKRLVFSGHSAGAHTAVLLGLDPRWLNAVGANPDNVKVVVGLSGPYDFYPFDKKRSIDAMAQFDQPLLTQPVNFARADAPAMLLITSSEDTTVRPRNAVALEAKLTAVGAPVTMINYQGLDHEDVVMALSVPFRKKGSVLADSVAYIEKHMPPSGDQQHAQAK